MIIDAFTTRARSICCQSLRELRMAFRYTMARESFCTLKKTAVLVRIYAPRNQKRHDSLFALAQIRSERPLLHA